MFANYNLTQNYDLKSSRLKERLKIMCLHVSYKEKYAKRYIFAPLKSLKKGVGSGSVSQRCGSGSAPKCHGSPSLIKTPQLFLLLT
jgi:hypothetical protein